MSGQIAAYCRVSTAAQSTDQQQDQIAATGISPDRWFIETASGSVGTVRP